MKLRNNNQNGSVAIFTVIILALLLSIITVSFVRLSVTESRQSVDDSLTTRAFYAAESGLEDARRAIREYTSDPTSVNLNEDVCRAADIVPTQGDGSVILSGDLNTAYTCQLIDLTSPNFEAQLGAFKSTTVPLNPDGGSFDTVVIEWHQPRFNGPYNLTNGTLLPPVGSWNGPAMIRAGFFSVPNVSVTRASFNLFGTVLKPVGSGGSGSYNMPSRNKLVTPVNCSVVSGDAYACSVSLSGFDSARKNYVRIMSLYKPTNIRVNMLSAGTPVDFDGAQATVDVTGRVSDVYRRIQARVNLAEYYSLPDYALWSNSEICKDFEVSTTNAFFVNNCNW